jgi:hypothetical protein
MVHNTETDCPCCGATIDALEILEEDLQCQNPECDAFREDMFDAAMDDEGDDRDLDAECRGLEDDLPDADEGPTIVYPYEGSARTVE